MTYSGRSDHHAGPTRVGRRDSSVAPPPSPPPPRSAPTPQRVVTSTVALAKEPTRRRQRRLAQLALVIVIISLLFGGGMTLLEGQNAPQQVVQAAEAPAFPETACGAEAPAVTSGGKPMTKPALALPKGVDLQAVIHTSCGDMKIDLLERTAPKAVANFAALARRGFYDGLTWHQVVGDALIQTGDPNGYNGVAPDDPGYTIPDELPGEHFRYTYGTVGMANTGGPDSSGSQFFIVTHGYDSYMAGEPEALAIEPTYTVFGRILPRFVGSLRNIAAQPVNGGADPLTKDAPRLPVYVEKVEIKTQRSK